jgi:large subunit ribosomal protein L27
MAHKKAGGSTANTRDSIGRRLGVKLFAGEYAKPGAIIIRQRGTKYHPGNNVLKGNDDSLFAKEGGFIEFQTKKMRKFNGQLKQSTIVHVVKNK